MSESNDQPVEQQPKSEPTPTGFMKLLSPRFHWQEGDGTGYVIGGVDGFPRPKEEPPPTEEEQ